MTSDRGLRALAAAAREGSLTGAAATLGLGQPAVSHAIRRLEADLGCRLLRRSRAGVTPTAVGAVLLESIQPAFEAIDAAVRSARGETDDPTVSISVSTSLATWWLLPRLPDFKRGHPELPLRIVTTDTDANVDLATLDLWIPLGLVDGPDLTVTAFCDEALVPVAAPELAATLLDAEPADLVHAPLLHLEERYEPRFDWKRWFELHSVVHPEALPGDRSTDYSLVLQAALDGQGIALGWSHLVEDLIADGRLVRLADPVTTEQPFVVVNSANRPLSPGAAALRSWLVDRARLHRRARD